MENRMPAGTESSVRELTAGQLAFTATTGPEVLPEEKVSDRVTASLRHAKQPPQCGNRSLRTLRAGNGSKGTDR